MQNLLERILHMNYSDVLEALQSASLFDLYRLSVAIRHEMENSERIKQLRQSFKEGDVVSYFDDTTNSLQSATVIQKNLKYVEVKNTKDQKHWRIPYYLLNLAHVNTDIHAKHQEKLSQNMLKVGECVGFSKDGEQVVGIVIRLNHKTVTLITPNQHRWRVAYSLLFKVIDAEVANMFDPKQLAQWIEAESAEQSPAS